MRITHYKPPPAGAFRAIPGGKTQTRKPGYENRDAGDLPVK